MFVFFVFLYASPFDPLDPVLVEVEDREVLDERQIPDLKDLLVLAKCRPQHREAHAAMTLPVWPTDLIEPLGDNWKLVRGDARRRGRGDQGPPRMRRGISKAVDQVQMSLMVTHNERARFERFYVEETGEGALPFLMPDWSRNGDHLTMADGTFLTDASGNRLTMSVTRACLFGDQLPSYAAVGTHWQLGLVVVYLP